jgi:hypothetical protein
MIVGIGCNGAGQMCWRGDRVLFPAAQSLVLYYSDAVQSLCCHHATNIASVWFSHDAALMCSGQESGVVSLWEVGGRCFWRDKSHLITAAFSDCNKYAVVVGKDAHNRMSISLFDIHTIRQDNNKTVPIAKQSGDMHVNRVIFVGKDTTVSGICLCHYSLNTHVFLIMCLH